MPAARSNRATIRAVPVILWIGFFILSPGTVRNAAGADGVQAKPLTLSAVIDLALESNRTLIGGGYQVDSRQLSVDGAWSDFAWAFAPGSDASAGDASRSVGAGVVLEKKFPLGPSVSLNPQVSRTEYDDEDDDDDGDFGAEVDLKLTVPLLRGFGKTVNLSGVRAAEYALRSARRSHDLAKVNIVLSTVSAVYEIVQQRELVAFYEDQAERFRQHAVMARAKEKVGLASPIDTYRAEIRLQDAQDSLNRTREALRNAGDNLKLILASPLETALRVDAPLTFRRVSITLDEAMTTAMETRLELVQVIDDIEEAGRIAKVAEHNLKPQLDLTAIYRRSGTDDRLDSAFELDEEQWSIHLSSTSDWARTSEKITHRQSLLAVRMARLNRWSKIDSIKQEVRQRFDALQKAEERMRIRQTQIDQARGKLALANVKFSHALADNFDVIEAETELQTARVNWLDAKIEHIIGRYRLRAAMGTLIQ